MAIHDIQEEYFDWMYSLATGGEKKIRGMYKLCRYLHERGFVPSQLYPMDENRAADGVDMRYKFARDAGYSNDYIDATFGRSVCSVFEMMVGLAYRCEHQIMENDRYGDRTWEWFNVMLRSLVLLDQTDDQINYRLCSDAIDDLLDHDYEPDGWGGLFYIPGYQGDMRDLDIWYQLMAYLETVNE